MSVYHRTNLTMRQFAPFFGCSSAAVCGVIHRLRPLLALEPAPQPVADVERLWIVDGTLVPVRDREVAVSSRNYRFSANVQAIVHADSRLVIASARPGPGEKADTHSCTARGRPTPNTDATAPAPSAVSPA
ncbi:hypothetical protein GCM10010327_41770 [Streptomyces nitrosporeus]|nr:hypothetical protein GCM10010327_41770 [Streptomyces nitrosporeus]